MCNIYQHLYQLSNVLNKFGQKLHYNFSVGNIDKYPIQLFNLHLSLCCPLTTIKLRTGCMDGEFSLVKFYPRKLSPI